MISITNLTKTMGKKIVLDNLNWDIPTNSVFGLVGPNGIGKSTLLRCIANIYKFDAGTITINGIDSIQAAKANSLVAYVSDDPFFFKNYNLHEMKEYYRIFYTSYDEAYFNKLVSIFNLDLKQKLSTYSKGMKRQASLILNLSIKPRYLLLDEAFDGLDPFKRLELKKLIVEELESRELTIIIASHNLREIEDIADSICLIDNGKVVFSNNSEDIKETYHKLQVAYDKDVDISTFDPINPIKVTRRGKVFEIVSKNNLHEIMTYLKSTQPIILEELPLSIEEIFILEVGGE